MKISLISLGTMLLFLCAVPAGAADVCANAKAGVTISDAAWADGVLNASGTWQAGEGTTGVMMEYRIESDREWVELRAGTSGTWEVTIPYRDCGSWSRDCIPGACDPIGSWKLLIEILLCAGRGSAVGKRVLTSEDLVHEAVVLRLLRGEPAVAV